MKLSTVQELLDPDCFADKSVVMNVRGKITKLWGVKSGTNQNGPWELQNGEFTDETGSIPICFSSCTQPTTARGKVVTLSCVKSDKHGWKGVTIDDREYEKGGQMVQTRELKVTAMANVDYGDGGSQRAAQTSKSPAKTGGSAQQPTQQSQSRSIGVHPKLVLQDLIALHYDVALLVNEKYGDEAKPEYIATIFIEASREGLPLDYIKRAAAVIKKTYPPAPKDPNKWKVCVMPWGKIEGKTLEEVTDEELKTAFDYFEKKEDNSDLAECVYQAALDRGVVQPPEPPPQEEVPGDTDGSLDAAPSDIPF